jgi:hypothetical protein
MNLDILWAALTALYPITIYKKFPKSCKKNLEKVVS